MDIYNIIKKKRDGNPLSRDEWISVITEYYSGRLPDYQMSALLMAGFLRGLNEDETLALTTALVESGEKLRWPDGPYVDKHSTGGVGDKITLIAVPIAASVGCKIPKLSGKGLGHTGGTIDKLNSIPGLSTKLTIEELNRITELNGCAIGEASDIAPADKLLYALRDATATVDSIPYITASILSKKIAAGAPNLVFDVKYGRGAFMKTLENAYNLAESLVKTGEKSGRRCQALLTSMEQPPGYSCGNALEVKEALQILSGNGPEDVRKLSLVIAAEMVNLAGVSSSIEQAESLCAESLDTGQAYERFNNMVYAQGAVPDYEKKLPVANEITPIIAGISGYLAGIDAYAVGRAVVALGGGRAKKEDGIDYSAGVVLHRKIGDEIRKGDIMAELHGGSSHRTDYAELMVKDAFDITEEPAETPTLIAEML